MKIGKLMVDWKNLSKVSKTYSLEKNGKTTTMNNEELVSMFKSNKVSISSNGILIVMIKKV